MKFYGNLVALCALCPATAFILKSPRASSKVSPAFSYNPETSVSDARSESLEKRLSTLEEESSTEASNESTFVILDKVSPLTVQGGSLKTWSFAHYAVEQVQVVLSTEGRPLDADIELWQGPDNTPVKMRVYVEDGSYRPFNTVIGTPRGPNTIAIRNTGHLEFPLAARVMAEPVHSPLAETPDNKPMIIQGGALRTYPFDPVVESVQVLLKTDGRPLNARVELLQGPNNNKEVIELYTEDGMDRPFFVVIETPGSGNVIRVVNTATVEFPLTASVEAYTMGDNNVAMQPVIGGSTPNW